MNSMLFSIVIWLVNFQQTVGRKIETEINFESQRLRNTTLIHSPSPSWTFLKRFFASGWPLQVLLPVRVPVLTDRCRLVASSSSCSPSCSSQPCVSCLEKNIFYKPLFICSVNFANKCDKLICFLKLQNYVENSCQPHLRKFFLQFVFNYNLIVPI